MWVEEWSVLSHRPPAIVRRCPVMGVVPSRKDVDPSACDVSNTDVVPLETDSVKWATVTVMVTGYSNGTLSHATTSSTGQRPPAATSVICMSLGCFLLYYSTSSLSITRGNVVKANCTATRRTALTYARALLSNSEILLVTRLLN